MILFAMTLGIDVLNIFTLKLGEGTLMSLTTRIILTGPDGVP